MNKTERIKLVKAMEYVARQINAEDIFLDLWLTDGVADGDIEYGDLEVRPGDEDEYGAGWYIQDEHFAELMEAVRMLRDRACREWAKAATGREFRRFYTLDVDKAARELREKRRREAAKKAAEYRAVLKKYKIGEDNYCEFVHTVFGKPYQGRGFEGIADQELDILSRRFIASGNAYVWPDVPGDVVATSKGISIPMQEARLALRAWASGKDMRKYDLHGYAVLSYTGDTIRIGCHEIPRENMLSLYREVMGRPFPGKSAKEVAA
jgi:hypothetical protein